jgi:hypothetical protein
VKKTILRRTDGNRWSDIELDALRVSDNEKLPERSENDPATIYVFHVIERGEIAQLGADLGADLEFIGYDIPVSPCAVRR